MHRNILTNLHTYVYVNVHKYILYKHTWCFYFFIHSLSILGVGFIYSYKEVKKRHITRHWLYAYTWGVSQSALQSHIISLYEYVIKTVALFQYLYTQYERGYIWQSTCIWHLWLFGLGTPKIKSRKSLIRMGNRLQFFSCSLFFSFVKTAAADVKTANRVSESDSLHCFKIL